MVDRPILSGKAGQPTKSNRFSFNLLDRQPSTIQEPEVPAPSTTPIETQIANEQLISEKLAKDQELKAIQERNSELQEQINSQPSAIEETIEREEDELEEERQELRALKIEKEQVRVQTEISRLHMELQKQPASVRQQIADKLGGDSFLEQLIDEEDNDVELELFEKHQELKRVKQEAEIKRIDAQINKIENPRVKGESGSGDGDFLGLQGIF